MSPFSCGFNFPWYRVLPVEPTGPVLAAIVPSQTLPQSILRSTEPDLEEVIRKRN
jgi:hypothetical protein